MVAVSGDRGQRGRCPSACCTMKSIIRQICGILLISGMLAAVVNRVHPHRIPWVQNWALHIETRARQEGIRMMPLRSALEEFGQGHAVFIDARSPAAFAEGHIPGALSMPLPSIDDHFEALGQLMDSGRRLVIYCGSRECDDALLMAIELQAMGASNVVWFVDGFEAWKKYGGATASSPSGRAPSGPVDGAEPMIQRSSLQGGEHP